uniref:Protein ytfJ n=1 Tax=Anopheles maculatus TaxID=74869 RepID=A0A182SG62_9DIPT
MAFVTHLRYQNFAFVEFECPYIFDVQPPSEQGECMKKSRLLIISLLLAPLLASAHNFQLQQRVAPIGVSDKGELNYDNDKFSYKSWNSAQLNGKVRVVQHIAGRTSAKDLNDPLIEAIKAAKLPHDRYQTTTIVNTDDAIIGTAMFVRNSIEDSKKTFPWSQFIVDSNGIVKKAWDLQPKGSAIVVLDQEGKIQFAKDGALTPQEVQQ